MKRSIFLYFLALISWAGCSVEHGLDEETSTDQVARFGLVAVSYGHDWAESGKGMVLTTTAQFVRYTAMNQDQVARLLALPLDPDRDLPSRERCKLFDLSVDLTAEVAKESETPGNVELLEAGDLQVQTQDRNVSLAPRHFPGLLPFISGVIYSEAEATLVEEVGKVKATSDGGEGVGAFSVQLTSPALPRLTHVGGAEPFQPLTLAKDRDLSLRWQTEGVNPGDVTYIELRFNRGKRDMALRCRPRDDGEFNIPQALLSEVNGSATVEMTRLRRNFFSASGLDQGELRVIVRDTVQLQ